MVTDTRACGSLGLCTGDEGPILLVPPRERPGNAVPSDDVWASAHLCDVLSLIFSAVGPCCTLGGP